ncbi:MAG: HEAT repeat domain-containing protein, partial [Candidatus Hydrogenedentes bacterium]|nr:HEAT repeat domain-containing protein [Candidatus Hydrogenedentota bacterium]
EMGTSTFKPLADSLDRNDVVLDLAGHTHIYERLHSIRAGKRDDKNGTLYLVNGGDIGANYPDWFTATNDNGKPYDQPTYTVFHMGEDRVTFRTFCWSRESESIIEIDYHIIWRDEAIPQAALAKLGSDKGDALRQTVVELGALSYAPAAANLVALLDSNDEALRRAAATSIRQIGTDSVAVSLVPYLGDKDLHVRREVARSLEIAMTPDVTQAVTTAVTDSAQDLATRVSLVGALQFHGEPAATTALYLRLIQDTSTTAAVRERAVYGLTHTVDVSQVDTVFDLFRAETESYVLARLAFTLNKLTGRIQNPDPKSAIGRSEPGEGRDKYIKKWRSWMEKEKAKEKKAA